MPFSAAIFIYDEVSQHTHDTLMNCDVDFAVKRFLMKLFRTSSIDVINDCRHNFSFSLPSELIEVRKAKFESEFNK